MAPFKSLAQKAWMKHNDPAMYKRWLEKYGDSGVPARLKEKMSKKRKG
jgi:hypothetical protein